MHVFEAEYAYLKTGSFERAILATPNTSSE
jgi:hypothetical protein